MLVGLLVVPASPLALAAGTASGSHGPDLAVSRAYVAGGVHFAEAGDSVTLVFSARDNGPGPADLSIDLRSINGIDRDANTTRVGCVLPGGALINADGNSCEPGFVKAHQNGSALVLTGNVTGTGDVVVRVCTSNLSGDRDPKPGNDCRTLKIAVD